MAFFTSLALGSILMLAGFFTTQSAYAATITLSVSDNITATALPTSTSGTTAVSDTTATNISISTDNTTGYTLSLTSSSSTAPALTGVTSSSNTISSISAETATLDSFSSGTWGYKPTKKVSGSWTDLTVAHGDSSYTAGYYLPGPTTTADVIDVTNAANSTANEYNIAVGTKISTSNAIDNYTGSFMIAVVANEVPLYMQDVNDWADTEIPDIGDSIQAVDKRDNKKYWVTRLCTSSGYSSGTACSSSEIWMTQNLDFNINSDTVGYLTSEYTDLNSTDTWAPSSTYYTATTTNTGSYSHDLGDYYWDPASNTSWTSCGSKWAKSYSDCTSYGFSTTKPTQDGAGNTIDGEHYQVGTLYAWYAATAGSGTTTIGNADATDSICPKGWRLPTSNSTTADKSFGKMFTAYGYSSWSDKKTIQNTPFFFIPMGYVESSYINNAGSYGAYWSSRAWSSSDTVYRLGFSSSSIDVSGIRDRSVGQNVRCVSRMSKTVTISANNANYGTVTKDSVVADSNSAISSNSYSVTIGNTTVTAVANDGYTLDSWANNCGSTLTANCTIIANFVDATTFEEAFASAGKSQTSGYYKMQDMDSNICSAVSTHVSTQLIDTRDNKAYWVSKLLDGNCWMTQNLDYDISATTNIISNTDGTSSTWTSSSTYAPQATTTSVFSNSSQTGTYSYDQGDYYIPGGSGTTTSTGKTLTDSSAKGDTNLHYHLGNIYQWNAATGGTGGTITSSDATASICPTGWRLPTSNSTTANYSFGKLLNTYGITSNGGSAVLLALPFFYVKSGIINSGSLSYVGSYGYFWSSRAYSYSSNACYLYFNSSYIYSSSNNYRNFGLSVRCISQ